MQKLESIWIIKESVDSNGVDTPVCVHIGKSSNL